MLDRSSAKLLVVVAYALTSTLGSTGLYLCITEQGHFRVEHRWNGGCLPVGCGGYDSTGTIDSAAFAACGSCGACTDIDLSLGLHSGSLSKSKVCSIASVEGLAADMAEHSASAEDARVSEMMSSLRRSPAFCGLRSVILLI